MTFAQEIAVASARHGLDASVVTALVRVESNGNPFAWNPEPRYPYLWDVGKNAPFRAATNAERRSMTPPGDFPALGGDPDHEWWGQMASWGLMQVMGAVARELGFKGAYLPGTCDPNVNLELGCRHLAKQLKWAGGNVEQALAAYNGGRAGNAVAPFRNQDYATKVILARYEMLNPPEETRV